MVATDGVSSGHYTLEGKLTLALASVVGRFQLGKMKAAGLPAFLCEPLEFLVERSLDLPDLQVVQII